MKAHHLTLTLLIALTFTSFTSAQRYVRPALWVDDAPGYLPGRWKVSLCILPKGHAWIRFQNLDNGDVRTISRFALLVGAWRENGEWIHGLTTKSGVYMDREQKHERDIRNGKYLLLSAVIHNPRIFKGANEGHGHGRWRNNCVTYTRDAWHYYTGEWYPLPRFHAPEDLLAKVIARHPEVVGR